MDLFLQRIVDGLSDGAIYSLVALAVVLVYRSTGVLNFAQGEMGMFCAFVTWKLVDPSAGLGLPLLVGIAGGVASGFVMGAGIERFVMRPFEGGNHLRLTMVTMGLFLVINSVAAYVFSTGTETLASPFGTGTLDLNPVHVTYNSLGVLGTLAVVSLLLWLLFAKTTLGITLRASSQSPDSSRLLGISTGSRLMLGWGLAGALGALAAILIAPSLFLSTQLMSTVMLYGFTAAVVGGLDSTVGAVVGGLAVGLVQSLASGYIPFIGTQLQLTTALVLVVIALILRPQGLFGRPRLERF